MKRREFMKFSAVFGATAFANPLFAREFYDLWCAFFAIFDDSGRAFAGKFG